LTVEFKKATTIPRIDITQYIAGNDGSNGIKAYAIKLMILPYTLH